MGLLGLDWLESKQIKKIKDDAFLRSVFPYEDKQAEKIYEILKLLFPNITIEDSKYNYIVTKQELENKDLNSLDKIELIHLIDYLNSIYITKNNDVYPYLVLADIDLKIDKDLNYPTIEEIQNLINLLREK